MSKRFTESNKWDDPFYQDLTPVLKCLWIYITDKCDNAGIWLVNKRTAEFNIGVKIDWDEVLKIFGDKITVFENGKKWLINKFIKFQYGDLTPNSPIFKGVLKTLKKHGIEYDINKNTINTLSIPYTYPTDTQKEKDKDKDKDKKKDKDIEGGPGGEKKIKEEYSINCPDPALVPVSFEEAKKELFNSETWQNDVARACKSSTMEIRLYLQQFLIAMKADDEWRRSYHDLKKHARNWIMKQIRENNKNNGKEDEIMKLPYSVREKIGNQQNDT